MLTEIPSLYSSESSSLILSRMKMAALRANDVAPGADGNGLRKLKILMLHGYTQSGPLFHAKTRALERLLVKSFPPSPPAPHKPTPGSLPAYPGGIQLIYPTAPLRVQHADIPGFDTSNARDESDAWGWFKLKKQDDGSGFYYGLDEGLETIRQAIHDAGGIDGVIGFSQGAATAALVASLLEPDRESAFAKHSACHQGAFSYPASWLKLRADLPQPPLKFAISYAGFFIPDGAYAPFYAPKIETRFLHFIGSLDTVVEEERSEGLVERCEDFARVVHPGGHFVPGGKICAGLVVGFLWDVLGREQRGTEDDSGVEDMDVPF